MCCCDIDFLDIVGEVEVEFNLMACERDGNSFKIDYDDYDYAIVEYLEDECTGYDVEYDFIIEDDNKFCEFRIEKRISDEQKIYLDGISNHIENELSDLSLENEEIIYVCKTIINNCGGGY